MKPGNLFLISCPIQHNTECITLYGRGYEGLGKIVMSVFLSFVYYIKSQTYLQNDNITWQRLRKGLNPGGQSAIEMIKKPEFQSQGGQN